MSALSFRSFGHLAIVIKAGMGDHELNCISPDQLRLPNHVFLSSSTPSDSTEHTNRRHSRVFILAGVIVLLGVGCFLAGVVLITLSKKEKSTTEHKTESCNTRNSSTSENESNPVNPCEFTLEAKRAGKVRMFAFKGVCYNNSHLALTIHISSVLRMICFTSILTFIFLFRQAVILLGLTILVGLTLTRLSSKHL